MQVDLFTVYIKEDKTISLEINEEVVNAYGISIEELSNRLETENIYNGIQDFMKALEGSN